MICIEIFTQILINFCLRYSYIYSQKKSGRAFTYANDFYSKGTMKLEEEEKTLKQKKTSYASTLFDVMIMSYYFYN